MKSLKVLSAAAVLALVLPLATPSFAGGPGRGGGGGHVGGGGGAHFGGGGGGPRVGGGGFGGGPRMGGGGGHFAGGGGAMRPSLGAGPSFGGGGGRPIASAGNNWHGGGGNWHGHGGGWRRHGGGGFWPGVAAGAAIGGIGSYAYYGGGYYNDPYYYGDDSYYDEPSVAVVPDSGGDASAYCAQRFKSYDPASGTYLGYDGQRHPCP
ncbi:BA14K family protein [Bradyrhizobium betae]